MTKRPLNTCNDCDYEWYPRGKDVSRKCPNCGSASVAIVAYAITDDNNISFKEGCAGLAIMGFVLWLFTKDMSMLNGALFFLGVAVIAQWPIQSLLVGLAILSLGLLTWAVWKIFIFTISVIGWIVNGVAFLLVSAWGGLLQFAKSVFRFAQAYSTQIIIGLVVSVLIVCLFRRSLARISGE